MLSKLLLTLTKRDDVSAEECSAIAALPGRLVHLDRGQDLVVQGSRPRESCMLLDGYAARSQSLVDGDRQFTSVHVTGDFVDLHALTLGIMDHSVIALTDCEVLYVKHTDLVRLIDQYPHVGRLFWMLTNIDAATHRAWITCLGRRAPLSHLAHLICELHERLQVVGLTQGESFDLPVTQSELADVLGLSIVHVNRTIQALRASRFVQWHGRTVTISDVKLLRELAEFDPTYLSLVRTPR